MKAVDLYKEALIRAAYRALLEREPEPDILTKQSPARNPEFEEYAERQLRTMTRSSEFGSRRRVEVPDFPLDTWVTATVASGLKLRLDLGDPYVSLACLRGDYEPRETAFLDKHVTPGSTFVDIGANIGWFTIRAGKAVGPTGRVIAFEPRSVTSGALSLSIAENNFSDRIELHRVALGAECGVQYIGCHENTHNPGGTWLLPHPELVQSFVNSGAAVQETQVETLDTLINGRKVDVIKIDVEGAEAIIFQSGIKTLSSRPVVLSEINNSGLKTISGVTAQEYMSFFRQIGFACHRITDDGELGGRLESMRELDLSRIANVVFVPQ